MSNFLMCIDCKHAVWPLQSTGECHHPQATDGTTTKDARAEGGICGSLGKLHEDKNEQ